MQAVQCRAYGAPDRLAVSEIETPRPGPDDILIRVAAAGINPLDWKIRSGALAKLLPLTLPLTLGWDVAGTVSEVGNEVRDFKPGDSVFGMIPIGAPGAYAEYALAPASAMARRPAALSPPAAATLPTVGLAAWQLVYELGRASAGETVLVLGAGGQVGRLCAALASRLENARVLAAGRAADLAAAALATAVSPIDSETPELERAAAAADVVIDTAGGDLLARACAALRGRARIVSSVQPPATGAMLQVHPDRAALRQLAELRAEGVLPAPPIESFALADAGRAHALGEAGTAAKLVLTVPS